MHTGRQGALVSRLNRTRNLNPNRPFLKSEGNRLRSVFFTSRHEGFFHLNPSEAVPKVFNAKNLILGTAIMLNVGNFQRIDDLVRFAIDMVDQK